MSPKLQKAWEGAYTIVKKVNNIVYSVCKFPKPKEAQGSAVESVKTIPRKQ